MKEKKRESRKRGNAVANYFPTSDRHCVVFTLYTFDVAVLSVYLACR